VGRGRGRGGDKGLAGDIDVRGLMSMSLSLSRILQFDGLPAERHWKKSIHTQNNQELHLVLWDLIYFLDNPV